MQKSAAIAIFALAMAGAMAQEPAVGYTQDPRTGPGDTSPIQKVVDLLQDLINKVRTDTRVEQMSYDRFACWCEDTMKRKAKDISDAEAKIDELTSEITKLSGDFGVHSAQVAYLKKSIKENIAATKEATDVRNNEHQAYETGKSESEQCIGGLEFAIKTLTGAGEAFLQAQPKMASEATLVGAADSIKAVLNLPSSRFANIPENDLDVIKQFVANPRDFLDAKKGAALVQNQNPFGDYAPQSAQIQGILKSMYESFTTDLEKDSGEEADKQKQFENLMATKKAELNTLQKSLEKEETAEATTSKNLADDKMDRSQTDAQLRDDKKFFKETKAGCRTKAADWSQRVGLRTQEQSGILEAIHIFTGQDGEVKEHLQRSHSKHHSARVASFLQTEIVTQQKMTAEFRRNAAVSRLHSLASKYGSTGMARVAAHAKLSGHFDEVIDEINEMVKNLRAEEQEDIKHRDRCQSKTEKNKHALEDLEEDITKTQEHIETLSSKKRQTENQLNEVKAAILATNKDIEDLTAQRDEDHKEFLSALSDDEQAVSTMDMAINALSKFYSENKKDLNTGAASLLQTSEAKQPEEQTAREYTVDPDKAPELSYDSKGGADYGGSSETGNIVALIQMIQEDVKNEIKVAHKEEKDARKEFMESKDTLKDTLDSQENSKVEAEKKISELSEKISNLDMDKAQLEEEEATQKDLEETLNTDCSWVATHFQKRREKRKNELEGLQEAKDFLAGVSADA